MGIFDIIELRQHVQAVGEYLFYIDAHCEPTKEAEHCHLFINDHLKKMSAILARLEEE